MLTAAHQTNVSQAEALDALARRVLAAQLRQLELRGEDDLERLDRGKGSIARDHRYPWLRESLRYAESVDAEAPERAWEQWRACLAGWKENADLAAKARLLDACLQSLPAWLSGETAATSVLFPGGSMALVEGVYKNNEVSDYFNRVLIESALAYVESRPHDAEPLRILEIGAGTGGATAGLLAALAPWRGAIGEYCYTDLSRAFLQHGEETFGRDHPFLRTRLFDVSRPCAEQGIDIGSYHLVVANNVLHATPDIRQTLRNAKAALRGGGLLLINEISEASLFTHLSFGLLEGWWNCRDAELRIPGCPGLSPAGWRAVLRQEGLGPALFPAEAAHGLGQQVILAASDGIIRQQAEAAPVDVPQSAGAPRDDEPIPQEQDSWRGRVGAYLRELVASTLKIPAARLHPARPLEEYGLDSILVVRLVNAFNQRFQSVDSALFFELPTLAALTEHFITHRDAELKLLLEQSVATAGDASSMAAPIGGEQAASIANAKPSGPPASGEGSAIAVIGLAGRYPGAPSLDAFWSNLAEGRCAIDEIPAQRWDWRRYFDPEKGKAGSSYTRWGGFLDDIDSFDPAFFRISRREAERMDPQERLFLETAYHCVEDAGYNPVALGRQGEVGVFVGAMNGGYNPMANHWSIANRVSYQLNLNGPSLVVDSACSSSLTAIHLAAESLAAGGCQLAIAGGVNLIVNPHHHLGLCEMMMLSPGERCSAFGADADGFVDAEGVGAALLKPLDKALADGDRIYGVIRGGAVNAGGKTNGYTVPSAGAQRRVLEKALSRAGMEAGRISYVEAHGTGTALGDPIEISGLVRAFGDSAAACAIGSVKSNIGHCESAAGIAGLSKVLLQLRRRQLAPTLHAERLNPKIDFDGTPFSLQRQLGPWRANGATRVAAVSSFGAGGANASLIVEEHIEAADPRPAPPGPWLIPLSARDLPRLEEMVARLRQYLASDDGRHVEMADLAHTLQQGREVMAQRLALLADSTMDLDEKLARWQAGEPDESQLSGRVDLFGDEEAANAKRPVEIERWLESGALAELAAAWVGGGEIDWPRLRRDPACRRPRRIGLPGYPFARQRCWLPGLPHPQPSAGASWRESEPGDRPALAAHALEECCYLPDWQACPADSKPAPIGPGAAVLVALGEGAAAERLLDALAQHYRGERKVARIVCGDGETSALGPERWHCGHADVQGFERIFAEIGEAACIVVMGPEAGETALADLADSTERHELPLLRLLKTAQRRLTADAWLDCFLISLGRYRADGQAVNALGAGMAGLGYSLAQGDHRVRLRNLDIVPAETADAATLQRLLAQIAAEPASERGEPVRLAGGERLAQRLVPLTLSAVGETALRQGGVYLILGGSGVIGRTISRQLIEHCQARVVWLGRKAADSPALKRSLAAAELRGRADYIQADATDLAQLRGAVAEARRRYGRIHGAVFSGMVFDFENGIQQTSEARFQEILDIKSRGSVNFYQALADEPLDFLCYFSSGQGFAFSGAARLSAYSCGIAFADAFAEWARPAAPFPVGVINWGFWRASLREQDISRHMDALEDEEGFVCFHRFVSLLAGGALPRMLSIRASAAVRQLMAAPEGVRYRLDPTADLPSAIGRVELEPTERARLRRVFDPLILDQSVAALLLIRLRELGVFAGMEMRDAENWRRQAGVVDRHGRWWAECLAILAEHGLLKRQGERFGLAGDMPADGRNAILTAWRRQLDGYLADPDRRAQAALIDDCLSKLTDILRGRAQATDTLFPDGSMDKVEGIYQRNTLSDFFNARLAETVAEQVRLLIERHPGRQVRILEAGAGTGGTTGAVLAALEPLADGIGEYCYTDLSRAFLRHGESRFAANRPYFRTRALDIGQPAETERQEDSGYDIVIATNVLHATANMRRTLSRAKSLLRGGGLLVVNELIRKTAAATATFGLLEGWWLYDDAGLRIPGSPLLAEDAWLGLLTSAGFRQAGALIDSGDELGQQIFVARSNGLILQQTGQAAPTPEAEENHLTSIHHPTASDLAERLQQLIVDALANALKADPDSISPRAPFSDYGVDSILGVGFIKQLAGRLDIPLNSAILFEQATVARLRDYLLAAYGAQVSRALGTDHATAGQPETEANGAEAQQISPVMAALVGAAKATEPSRGTEGGGRIAVIGMAGQFPGADDPNQLWGKLLAGVDCVEALPEHYLAPDAYSADKQPGKSQCRRAGILKNRDCFDPLFFNLTPREAEAMTPHQRLVMQEGWKALEDAGYNPMALAGQTVGVYVGAEPGGYQHDSFTGASEAIVASRLSYFLDLRGPAMTINTGCSSSGVAIHQACESLRRGESRMALAGGVYALLDQKGLISLSAIDMLSPSGRCHAFDASADGTVISEGVGMVALKRLEDAIADGDPIYGVIEASGINQDGASNGITAPNGEAQEQLILDVYRKFGIDPARISYVEAHGTGTRLGDPVEAGALIRAFRRLSDASGYCALGSAKASLGHAAASAGVIGLIKVLLSLRHGKLPAMPGFERLNPLIDLDASPFYINRQAIDWPAGGRLAALNAFGHSGTNVHLVIGEYEPAPSIRAEAPAAARIFPLSAQCEDSLRDYARALAQWLDRIDAPEAAALADAAFTLQTARESMRIRAALEAGSVAELRAGLQKLSEGARMTLTDSDAGRLAESWAAGGKVDWAALWPAGSARRIHLPAYAFAKERYWIDQRPQSAGASTPRDIDTGASPETGLLLAQPVWRKPLASADSPETGRKVLWLAGFSESQAAQLSAAAGNAFDCDVLALDKATPAARYQALALALLRHLQALDGPARIELWIAERTPADALLAGLDGMLKTACLERGDLCARCLLVPVDEDAPLAADRIADLERTLAAAPRGGACSLQRSGQEEESLELQWLALKDSAIVPDERPWRNGGVYLITGGAGGLGLIFAEDIAARCSGVTLILLGRSALDAGREARLQKMRDAGAQVRYCRLDLTDGEALNALMEEVRAEYGGLDGVLHAAGVNRDRSLARKTAQELVEVFAAKVIGTELLDRACRRFRLDFFALFSSCSAALGSAGQADYAAANGFMDHFAGWRNRRVSEGLCFGRTLSINYPLWRDGGMRVDAAAEASIRSLTGMVPMQSGHGLRALALGLGAGLERLLVIEGDLPRLRAHIGVEPSKPMVDASGGAAVKLDGERLLAVTRERLKNVFCEVTKLPADRVELEAPLERYGIDSIMITRLNQALDVAVSQLASLPASERQLSKTLFFECRTLAAAAEHLAQRHPRACAAWSGLDEAPAQTDNGARAAEPAQPAGQEPIAVIGLSGRYPQAEDLDAFWRNLRAGRDAVTEIPPARWPLEGFYVDSVQEAVKQGLSYSKWGGFLDNFADFDPLFFNIAPREALNMDPQERLFLQTCWLAMEDAGLTRADLTGRFQGEVGVFVGITKTGYGLYGPALREQGKIVFPRTSFGSAANRVSYVLGLSGPSEPVDTMCSSSLTALHRACESLRRGECRMAFAGGVNLYLHPSNYVELCAGQMLSRDGICRSFGEGGNGFVPGEGVGALLLKPLSQALADRDNIHAVILATAVNHGGKTHGYTVPNPQAQAAVIRQTIERAGLNAAQISYVEAHGTGTELGDPIEVSGLSQAFAPDGVPPGSCALGSVKASIGHLEAAAGIVGVSKVILQFRHGQLPPSLNADKLNPNLALETTPFRLQRQLEDWLSPDGGPRIAGVSSFGAGGANAHVLLREYAEYREPALGGEEAIVLSARDGERLLAYAEALLSHVEARPGMTAADLANLAHTLQIGREAMSARLGLLAQSPAELAAKLRAFVEGGGNPVDGVCRGEAKRGAAAEGADEGDAQALLSAWVAGAAVDWARLRARRGGPEPFRVSLPAYPFARQTFWPVANGPRANAAGMAEAAGEAVPASGLSDADAFSFAAHWRPEAGEGHGQDIGRQRCVLIVAPASAAAAAEALARLYQADAGFSSAGGRVILAEPGARSLERSPGRWIWDAGDPQALGRMQDGHPAIDCLYFIGEAGDPNDWDALKSSPRRNEVLLLRLVQWLKRHGHEQGVDCYIVSQNNFDVAGSTASAFGGGLTGLAYAIAQGEHRFRVRNIDADSRELADPIRLHQWASQVSAERGLARGDALCLRGGVRYRQAIRALDWQGVASGPALRQGGVYLILGGAGTVGSVISRYLLAECQATVVWLGRRAADDAGVRRRLADCLAAAGADSARLDYLQADANDEASLRRAVAAAKRRYGAIHGAVFSGVVFGSEEPVGRMAEPLFREIMEVKSRGSVAFYRALAGEALDFLCYFSSAQSFAFSGAAKLPAYAAGITFTDSLVRSLGRSAPFPVGVINWGFWQASLRERQAADPSAQAMSRHAAALEDRNGCACFVRFVQALRAGALKQAICMAASAPVRQLMGLSTEPAAPAGDGFERYHADAAPLLAAHDPEPFDRAMAGMLLAQLRGMGLFAEAGRFEDGETLRRSARIGEQYGRWWRTCLELLERQGLVRLRGAEACATDMALSDDLGAYWRRLRDELSADSQRQAQVALADACLQRLPEILDGRLQATDVIFPRSSMEKVEGVYRNNARSDYFNRVVADVALTHVETLLAADSQRRIRILEIGAGTGGTTSVVLPVLRPRSERIAEYCYTDVSKAFLMYARKTYGADYPFLSYRLWDVEQPPESQEVEVGAYDIVIAANVLHATANIRRTLRHAASALRDGGLLLLNEISDRSLFSHLTFGLLKGWWLYEDPELRIPGTPALHPESWSAALESSGFGGVRFPAGGAHILGQQIIVAERRGAKADAKPATVAAPGRLVVGGSEASGGGTGLMAAALASLADALQMDAKQIQPDQPFADYGIDSILGVGFVDALGKVLGEALNTALLFDYPTLDSLVAHLQQRWPAACARLEREAARLDAKTGDKETLAALITDALAETLQLEPAQIDCEQPFSDYGLDSILGAGLVDRLGSELGMELGAAILFEYPTVASLADYLDGLHAQCRPADTGAAKEALIRVPAAEGLERRFLSGELSVDVLLDLVSRDALAQ
ncbi:SDR family NAD(P)-dependent oxidoreductase [Chromobacterium violaceum]|uniref:SDR family NAD(P)-dependent oxidoreductase n=1 Tax=Chromobacterium violaceum TaxID=536 RepID=UPI0005D2FB5B|nr:SDR family NAD(P)-dependent oxidoreductase [Chromobacterium violaceum]KJH66470.1 polyketide synthase [Chromobacterium violaceum]